MITNKRAGEIYKKVVNILRKPRKEDKTMTLAILAFSHILSMQEEKLKHIEKQTELMARTVEATELIAKSLQIIAEKLDVHS